MVGFFVREGGQLHFKRRELQSGYAQCKRSNFISRPSNMSAPHFAPNDFSSASTSGWLSAKYTGCLL